MKPVREDSLHFVGQLLFNGHLGLGRSWNVLIQQTDTPTLGNRTMESVTVMSSSSSALSAFAFLLELWKVDGI